MPRLFLPNGDFGMGRRIDLLQYGEASQKIDYLCAQRANGLFAQACTQFMSPPAMCHVSTKWHTNSIDKTCGR